MGLNLVMNDRHIYQQEKQWFVLDEDFSWDLSDLRKDVFYCMEKELDIPVIFCDSCEANKIAAELGAEEAEYFPFASGLYWREVGIVFIFEFDEYIPLVEVLFHELRHVMQEEIPELKVHFESDKKLPYDERITEKDAFSYASQYLEKYISERQQTIS